MVTPVKRMLPARLGVFKRAIYALATGWRPSAATATATATAPTAPPTAAPADTAAPLAFVDTQVADVVADIEARSRAPLGLPTLPPLPQADRQQKQAGDVPTTRAQRSNNTKGLSQQQRQRAKKGLAPGQWDPAALGLLQDKRSKELLERKSYLRNFWYCVGELLLLLLRACMVWLRQALQQEDEHVALLLHQPQHLHAALTITIAALDEPVLTSSWASCCLAGSSTQSLMRTPCADVLRPSTVCFS